MKIGDLIQHRQSKIVGLIVNELGPVKEKPYFYYDVVMCSGGRQNSMRAPLNLLARLWEVISEA